MLETWLATYGYPVLLAGTFLEGETILVLAGVAAHMGYLSLDLVIACGFLGSLAGDQLYFHIGRRHGRSLLSRHPTWQTRIRKVLDRLERHQNLILLSFRFLYGLRTATPFAVGLSSIHWLRFTLFNVIGAGLWSVSIALAGYYFGQVVEAIIGDIRHYELEVMAGIVLVAVLFWLYRRYRVAHHARTQAPTSR